MNLISRTHHSCERREHAFMVLQEYTIISPVKESKVLELHVIMLVSTVRDNIKIRVNYYGRL